MMKKYKSYHAILAAEAQENNVNVQSSDNPNPRTPGSPRSAQEPPVQGGDDMAH